MALFSSPVFFDDHLERAVRTGLEMQDLLAAFNPEQVAWGKPSLRIGIGIATGNVIAGFTETLQPYERNQQDKTIRPYAKL